MCNSSFSKSLFRYTPFNNKNEKYIRRLLIDNRIYFPKPSELNDPYDCTADLSIGETEEEKIDYLSRMLKQPDSPLGHITDKDLKTNLRKMNWQTDKTIHQKVYSTIEKLVEQIGVLCFTEKPDSLLMWAHYAINHTGLCLQFDFKEGSLLKEKCDEVTYSKNYPKLNLAKNPENTWVKKVLLTKSEDWKYEHEWRFIDFRGFGEKTIPPDFVKGIIFGLRMPEENKNCISSWYKDEEYIPQFYEVKKHKNRYMLKITGL